MAGKPLSVRVLEQRKILHEVFEFDTGIRSAVEVAQETGVRPEAVLKTLVIEQDPPRGKPYLLMMPADGDVDLKVLAAALGVKKVRMASHKEAERQTGLQVGGISALALLNKGFTVLIEEGARSQPHVLVSAGQRGMDLRLATSDLVSVTGARAIAARGAGGTSSDGNASGTA